MDNKKYFVHGGYTQKNIYNEELLKEFSTFHDAKYFASTELISWDKIVIYCGTEEDYLDNDPVEVMTYGFKDHVNSIDYNSLETNIGYMIEALHFLEDMEDEVSKVAYDKRDIISDKVKERFKAIDGNFVGAINTLEKSIDFLDEVMDESDE